MSYLRDDWFSLGVGSPQQPDTLVSCVFKTEFVTHLRAATPGGLDLRIGPVIEYAKKPGKMAAVKVVKDPAIPRDDLYKSSTIHVGPGEPPNSSSRPTPKGKPVAARPVTTGKLLRPSMTSTPNVNANASRPVPPKPAVPEGRTVPQNLIAALNTHSRNSSTGSATRLPPPAPPAPPAAPPRVADPTCRALYDFAGQTENELSLSKDEVVIIIRKEENGWWLTKKKNSTEQGWVPSAYLEEEVAPPPPPPPPPIAPARPANGAARAAAGKKPAPPAPPAKRPTVGRKPVAVENRSSVAGSTTSSSSGAGSSTTSFAPGLAQAVSLPNNLPSHKY